MSPTVFRAGGFRFFFFSREERRAHVHVQGEKGEAKFWIEPRIELAGSHRLAEHELNVARTLIEERIDEIRTAWQRHFGG